MVGLGQVVHEELVAGLEARLLLGVLLLLFLEGECVLYARVSWLFLEDLFI